MTAPLIGFEGPIAAGKTTIAKLLSEYTAYKLVLEHFDENEFLFDFYADATRWALPMQLWFLNERQEQLAEIAARPRSPIVADYTSMKNDVFASLLLRDREWRLYSALSTRLDRQVRHPDVIVYLDAPNKILLRRIYERGRLYEASIDAAYLDGLRAAYETSIGAPDCPTIIRRDTSEFALTDAPAMHRLFEDILYTVNRRGDKDMIKP